MKLLDLSFPAFFQCGVKPFANMTQKDCIHILFFGLRSSEVGAGKEYKDAMCTRFVSGATAISKDICGAILSLSSDEIEERIRHLAIQDEALSVSSLERLVRVSSISPDSKKKLLDIKDNSDPITFIAAVYQQAIKAKVKRKKKLSSDELEVIQYCITGQEMSIFSRTGDDIIREEETDEKRQGEDPSTDLWRKKLEKTYEIKVNGQPSTQFTELATSMSYRRIKCPEDFYALLYALLPATQDNGFIKLDIADIVNVLHLDMEKKTLGFEVDLWEFSGLAKVVADMIKLQDFNNATGLLLQVSTSHDIGLRDVTDIVNAAQESLDPDANIIFGAAFDDTILTGGCKVTLLTSLDKDARLSKLPHDENRHPDDQRIKRSKSERRKESITSDVRVESDSSKRSKEIDILLGHEIDDPDPFEEIFKIFDRKHEV